MITTVDEFLAQGYRREQIDLRPLTDADIAAMVRRGRTVLTLGPLRSITLDPLPFP